MFLIGISNDVKFIKYAFKLLITRNNSCKKEQTVNKITY